MSWTQPVCERCFGIEKPGRVPPRVRDAERETCCYCGDPTYTGVYIRVDPATVPYPTNPDEGTGQ